MDQKKRYFIHYVDSEFYLGLGMRAKKTQNFCRFKQSFWLAKFIKYNNTEQRTKAKIEFEKPLYNLLNKFIYKEKTSENV